MIIFLNGTSSAGKTSTAKKIQELYPNPMLHMGIDHFFFSVDPRYMGDGQEAHLGYQFVRTDDAMGTKIEVKKGAFGNLLSQSLHRALRVGESAKGTSPSAALRTGRDTLASSGSH